MMTISFTPQFRQADRGLSLALSLGLSLSLSLSLLGSIGLTGSARADAPLCSAPGTGNPCAAGAGNPINVITGNKFQQESDLPALPGVLGLEIVRYYNSDLSGPGIATGILGRGWKLSYEAELTLGARSIRLVEADGTVIDFGRDPLNPARASNVNPANGSLAIRRTGRGDEVTWTKADGQRYSFDPRGKLTQILAVTGEFVSLQHDARGWLVRVTDPQGRSLQLSYLDSNTAKANDRFRGVQSITSPVGQFSYQYGSIKPKGSSIADIKLLPNLVAVGYPDSSSNSNDKTGQHSGRQYHYEDAQHPTLLTGISIVGGTNTESKTNQTNQTNQTNIQRYATFGYQSDGKAILSTHANNVDKVTLDYRVPNQTTLTNSLGQSTLYRHGVISDQYRLTEVRGAGCALCGEPNVRYRYDQLARLTASTKLSVTGEPIATIQTELDYYGRPLLVHHISYSSDKTGSVASAPQLLARYVYTGEQAQPSLVARPSVVPGKELITKISYNQNGQPISITDTGWSPAISNKDQPTQIERSTRYGYTGINGRSLLSQLDGPLANGKSNSPLDSDITQISWDSQGSAVTAMTVPGGDSSKLQYDNAGRIASVTNAEGHKTNFSYDSRNQLIATTSDGQTQRTQYDSLGNAIETGSGEGSAYQASAHFGFDEAGRHTWSASTLGIMALKRYDTENRLLETSTQTARIKQTHSYTYDLLGRLISSTDASGATRSIGYNEQGLPDVMRDTLGRERHYRYDALGNLSQVIAAANTQQAQLHNTATRFGHDAQGQTNTVIAPNGATTRYVRDDFNRTIAITSPDSGTLTRSYDAAGRIEASTDAAGNRARYEFDVAGRIVKQTVIEAKAQGTASKPSITTWMYQGQHLVAIDTPEQSERYRYDKNGQLSSKTVLLTLANGTQSTSITHYRYDERGQLTSASLPDGSSITYQRNAQQQIIAMQRSQIQTPWLRWLLPAKNIVQDLQRDLIGLSHARYGNGIEAFYQRSREGNLARIVYRHPKAGVGAAPFSGQSAAFESVLGISSAHAAQNPITADSKNTSALPGALGLPVDKDALLEHRYLWDTQGNLLHTQSKIDKGRATSNYAYDAQDRLIVTGTASAHIGGSATKASTKINTGLSASSPATATASASYARYFYDGAGNRLLAQENIQDQSDSQSNTIKTAYQANSNRWQQKSSSDSAAAQLSRASYDENGQPNTIGQREYVWDALGRLTEVRQETGKQNENHTLASYRYNHKGERISKRVGDRQTNYLYAGRKLIAELNAQGRVMRQYLYLADQPIAIIDSPQGSTLESEERTPLSQIAADLKTVWQGWFGESDTTAYLHNNHLGATEMVTNDKGAPVWQAAYSAYGKVQQASYTTSQSTPQQHSHFTLNLRLPGQYEDEETGLYYNDHRYYDPDRGQYLTPDPLGLRGGINSYAYVANNPLKFVDPSGLILFAFDGTNNSNPPPGVDDFSNVYKFYLAYDVDQNGPAWYMNGVGRDDPDSHIQTNWSDDLDGNTARARVEYMLKKLDDYMSNTTFQKNEAVNIDITGFSRGAAMARDFSNKVAQRLQNNSFSKSGACVQIRFMGLWDTVAQFGPNGAANSDWQLAIPTEAKNVFQAVALNEHRVLFPGESIGSGTQRGFIGSHADIGGSYGTGDLSDVALNWIVEQAKTSGLKMKTWDEIQHSEWGVVTNPVLHDKSTGLFDRDFCLRKNNEAWVTNCQKQKQATPGGMTWSQTQTGNFINLYSQSTMDADGSSKIVGEVNMKEYAAWLKQNYGIDIQYSGN